MKPTRLFTALTLLATLSSSAALAQSRPVPPSPSQGTTVMVEPGARTLRVEGLGETKAEPDEAFIDLAVETTAPTAKAAAEENARKMDKVLTALTQAGVARKDLDTRNYTVYPEYAPVPVTGGEPKLKGYRVSNTVEAHVRDVTQVGALLDRALGAGANRVENVRFGLSKQDAVQAEALRQAIQRARNTAQVMAAALGVKLGPVLDASTISEPPRFYPVSLARAEAADMGAPPTTPIQPDEQTITARVTLIFGIE
jgi:hypothetical protein